MTEAEQIEAWREQFESEFDDVSKKYDSGIYRNSHRESMWQGFLMAKRSQPVIELPKPYIDYDEDDNPVKYWTKKQIDAAQIKYIIKE